MEVVRLAIAFVHEARKRTGEKLELDVRVHPFVFHDIMCAFSMRELNHQASYQVVDGRERIVVMGCITVTPEDRE